MFEVKEKLNKEGFNHGDTKKELVDLTNMPTQ